MFNDFLRKITELQFFAFMALLVAVESILVLAGALPPMMEDHIGHTIFFLLRMAVFVCFARTIAGKPLSQTAVKGAVIALVGAITEVIFVFIGRASDRVLLGIAMPSETVLYLALAISAMLNAVFGAVVVSTGAWILSQASPKAAARRRIKKRKR